MDAGRVYPSISLQVGFGAGGSGENRLRHRMGDPVEAQESAAVMDG